MLRYRHLGLVNSRIEKNFPEDTIRVMKHGITLSKINCRVTQRNYLLNSTKPDSSRDIMSFYENVEETTMLILALNGLSSWIDKQTDSEFVVYVVQDLRIIVDNNEVSVRTQCETLRKEIKDVVEKEGKRFRTLRV